ncbi:MAG: hypothetical protein GVY18_03685 [Bacteroidetes bacterium]|jgi:hypothetical protein|nr:hypothetical protein [Bacteroidota bacterium]
MNTLAVLLLLSSLCLLGCDSAETTAVETPPPPATPDSVTLAQVPDRRPDARTGTAFLDATDGLSYAVRQQIAVDEVLSGNVPAVLRTLAPISFVSGTGDSLTVWVTRDYLAIGSDADFVRMPLSLPSARTIAQTFELVLPTARLVDAIYAQADLQLDPQPMTPGPEMRSNAYYGSHQRMIEEQRAGRAPDGLIAGHKKDVVVTTRMNSQPGRVPIYGWHRSVGDPIQPLSLVHGATYEDYSHGLRLIHPVAHVNGEAVALNALVRDPQWGPLLSGETGLDLETLSWGR